MSLSPTTSRQWPEVMFDQECITSLLSSRNYKISNEYEKHRKVPDEEGQYALVTLDGDIVKDLQLVDVETISGESYCIHINSAVVISLPRSQKMVGPLKRFTCLKDLITEI